MPLFGSARDISFIRKINRELINDIIEQKVGYYKIVLEASKTNIYGESNGTKIFKDPVLINCLIERNEQETSVDEFGPDITRNCTFRFLRDDLAGNDRETEDPNYQIIPENGDVILWNNDYYEIDRIIENQLILGKDPSYSYSNDTDSFGSSLSIIVSGIYVRPEKLGIKQERI